MNHKIPLSIPEDNKRTTDQPNTMQMLTAADHLTRDAPASTEFWVPKLDAEGNIEMIKAYIC